LKYAAILILSLALFASIASSQLKTASTPQAPPISIVVTDSDVQQQMQQTQMARLNAERHAQLRIDTAKLVALTAELKEHVDKAGINTLSMDVIKTAQEIEKLAKSVQDKMRHAY